MNIHMIEDMITSTEIFQKCVKYNVYEYKKVLRGK